MTHQSGQVAFVPFICDEYGAIGDHGHGLLSVLATRATASMRLAQGQTRGLAQADLIKWWRGQSLCQPPPQIIMMMAARAGKDGTRGMDH